MEDSKPPSEGQAAKGRPRREASRVGGVIAWLGALGVVTVAAAVSLGWLWWPLDLAGSFRLQFGIVAIGVVLLCLLLRRWLPAALSMVGGGVLWMPVLTLYAAPPAEPASDAVLALLQWNTARSSELAGFLEYAAEVDADVVVLHEVTPAMMPTLEAAAGHRVIRAVAREDTRGGAVLARQSIEPTPTARVHHLAGEDRPTLDLALRFDGRAVRVLGFHAKRPDSAEHYAIQQREYDAAADWVARRGNAGELAVIIGDFNATPWGQPVRTLMRRGGLRNSQEGYGLHTTFPAALPAPLRIPIDLCLHDAELVTRERSLGPAHGSDHLPVLVRLSVRR